MYRVFYYKLIDSLKETLDIPAELHNVTIEVSCIPYDGAYLGQITCCRGNKYTLFTVRELTKESAYKTCSDWLDFHYVLSAEEF